MCAFKFSIQLLPMIVSVIGSKGLAAKLGKKGTSSDITLYNTSFQGEYFTFVEPETYPEKIQALFQSLNMSQFTILHITNETPRNVIGECIIAVDMLKKPGIIVSDSFGDDMKKFLAGTSLESFPILPENPADIMPALAGAAPAKTDGKTKVVLDHSFNIKSVGTVALGTVISGEINKHDNLVAYPSGKAAMIKSIQIHDKECEKGSCFDRVGLSVKGVEVSDLQRGTVISSSMRCIKELNITFRKNKFFRDDVPKNVMCIIGMQYASASLEENKLAFLKEIAFDGEEIIILTPDRKMRIAGTAIEI